MRPRYLHTFEHFTAGAPRHPSFLPGAPRIEALAHWRALRDDFDDRYGREKRHWTELVDGSVGSAWGYVLPAPAGSLDSDSGGDGDGVSSGDDNDEEDDDDRAATGVISVLATAAGCATVAQLALRPLTFYFGACDREDTVSFLALPASVTEVSGNNATTVGGAVLEVGRRGGSGGGGGGGSGDGSGGCGGTGCATCTVDPMAVRAGDDAVAGAPAAAQQARAIARALQLPALGELRWRLSFLPGPE